MCKTFNCYYGMDRNKVADWVAIAMHFYSLDCVLSFGVGTSPLCHVKLLNDVVTGRLVFPVKGALRHPSQTLHYDVGDTIYHQQLLLHIFYFILNM